MLGGYDPNALVMGVRVSHTASRNCQGCGKRYPSIEFPVGVVSPALAGLWCADCLKRRGVRYRLLNPPRRDPAWTCPVHRRRLQIEHHPGPNAVYVGGVLRSGPETIISEKVCPGGDRYPIDWPGPTERDP